MAALCATPLVFAQDQQPGSRRGWPCAGRPDPAYFRIAEGTGGQFFMFHPSEVAGSGGLMALAMAHRETVLRAGGQLAAGLHEFAVPVDRADSLLFSISVQCLRIVEIVRPSGEVLQASGAGVDYSHFEAGLFVTIANPDAGLWHVRLSGSRLFLAVVQARAALSLDAPRFVPDGPPRAGVPQVVRFRVDGARDVRARLVTQGFQDLAPIALRSEPDGAGGGTFAGEIIPTARSFRVVVSGRDAEGLAFQRVHAPLFEPAPPAR